MQREIRTLWWCAQGTLLFLILVANGFVFLGWGFMLVHIGGAIYSQFIQEEEKYPNSV